MRGLPFAHKRRRAGEPERIAVLGAGLTGLTAAYRLTRSGHAVDVYERWPGLGGQAATFELPDGSRLERYYHHLFTSDRHIAELYEELGLPDEIELLDSSTAFFVDGRSWPFSSPADLLRFAPVSLLTRVRMGLAVLLLQRSKKPLDEYESITIEQWIRTRMGDQAWDVVWAPLLRGKFGRRAEEIAMVWLARKLQVRRDFADDQARTEVLGYPRTSWELLFTRLREEIEAAGGRVMTDRPAAALTRDRDGFTLKTGREGSYRQGHDPRAFALRRGSERYDQVVAAVPSPVFAELLSDRLREEVGAPYLDRALAIDVQSALCLVLVSRESISPFYWTNIADEALPFLGVIEHTRFVPRDRYGGKHIVYVTNYLEAGDPLLSMSDDDLIGHYASGLRAINPRFDEDWIEASWVFREPYAQPIVDVGYKARIPSLATPAAGLYLGNPTQVYPEDRGTNYAVRLGNQLAELIERRG